MRTTHVALAVVLLMTFLCFGYTIFRTRSAAHEDRNVTNWQWPNDWGMGTTPVTTPPTVPVRPEPTNPVEPTRPVQPPAAVQVDTYDAAIAEAKKLNRLAFVYVGAEWCPPCREMKKNVFPDPKVKTALGKHVVVFLDADQSPDVRRKFGIQSLPTYLLVDSSEKVVKMDIGGRSADQMVDWLR